MSTTQNEKIRQVTETTMVIGVDIASEVHWARAFDWRGLELGKVIHFENSAEGFASFQNWASELSAKAGKDQTIVGLEPTGHWFWSIHIMLSAARNLTTGIRRKTTERIRKPLRNWCWKGAIRSRTFRNHCMRSCAR